MVPTNEGWNFKTKYPKTKILFNIIIKGKIIRQYNSPTSNRYSSDSPTHYIISVPYPYSLDFLKSYPNEIDFQYKPIPTIRELKEIKKNKDLWCHIKKYYPSWAKRWNNRNKPKKFNGAIKMIFNTENHITIHYLRSGSVHIRGKCGVDYIKHVQEMNDIIDNMVIKSDFFNISIQHKMKGLYIARLDGGSMNFKKCLSKIPVPKNLKKGDIISFVVPFDGITAHRIYKIDGDLIYTKGDNNKRIDKFPTHRKMVIGKIVKTWS